MSETELGVNAFVLFIQENGPFEQSNLRLKVMGRDVFFGPLKKPQLHADEDLVFFWYFLCMNEVDYLLYIIQHEYVLYIIYH